MVKKSSLEQPKSVVIAGRDALKLLWDDWAKLDNKTLQSAAQFRRFARMLDVRQMSKVNDLVRDQVRTMTAAAMTDSVCDVPFPAGDDCTNSNASSADMAIVPLDVAAVHSCGASGKPVASKEQGAQQAKSKQKKKLLQMFKK